MANRLRGRFGYPQDEPFRVTFRPDRLKKPYHWHKPRRIFVCSMGDLFHDQVTYEQQLSVFETIAEASRHTFLILTKRPKNMWDFVVSVEDWEDDHFEHVWWGVTVELQKYIPRIITLLNIPAAKRFVSLEPLLGPVDFVLLNTGMMISREGISLDKFNTLTGRCGDIKTSKIDWVIVGGLTLPGGKIQAPKREWVDSIVEQCSEAYVPIFIKDNCQYPIQRHQFPKTMGEVNHG